MAASEAAAPECQELDPVLAVQAALGDEPSEPSLIKETSRAERHAEGEALGKVRNELLADSLSKTIGEVFVLQPCANAQMKNMTLRDWMRAQKVVILTCVSTAHIGQIQAVASQHGYACVGWPQMWGCNLVLVPLERFTVKAVEPFPYIGEHIRRTGLQVTLFHPSSQEDVGVIALHIDSMDVSDRHFVELLEQTARWRPETPVCVGISSSDSRLHSKFVDLPLMMP